MVYIRLLIFTILLFCIHQAVNAIEVDVIPKESNVFLEEGSNFTVQCNAFYTTTPSPSDVQPDIYFVFRTTRATNSSNHIIIERRDTVAKTVNLTIIFTKLTVNDGKGLGCRDNIAKSTIQIKMYVIPKTAIPQLSVSPVNIIANEGANVVLTCNATIQDASSIDLALIWKFGTVDNAVPSNANASVMSVNATTKRSSLTISNLQKYTNEGLYYCRAVLTISDGLAKINVSKIYSKKADVTVISKTNDNGGDDGEQKKNAGENVLFKCSVAINKDTLKWYKGNNEINNDTDSRYTFRGAVGEEFIISDITYTDRDKYMCRSMLTNRERYFVLRVRDPLGALWPFIGIVVEAIVLALLIFVCEMKRKRNKAKGRPTEMKETSSLIQTTPKVSYSGGDNVRARVTSGSSA